MPLIFCWKMLEICKRGRKIEMLQHPCNRFSLNFMKLGIRCTGGGIIDIYYYFPNKFV